MTQPQHDDPIAEARAHLLQGLAVLATVGEAAARWSAVSLTHRLAEDQAALAARQRWADEAAAARTEIDQALGPWLRRATLPQVARAWRTAAVHATGGNAR